MSSRSYSALSKTHKPSLFTSIIPLIFILFPLFLNGQEENEPIRCAMDQWLEQKMQDPDFARDFNQKEAYYRTRGSIRNPSCGNPIVLPVAIHWSGNIEDVPCLLDIANDQIQVLNEDFGGYNEDIINYCDHSTECPDEYDTDAITGGTCIQFCLATMDHPSGSGLSDGDPAFTFGQYTFDTDADPWSGYVNIFVSDVSPSGYGSNLLGLAPLFGGANPNGNGVFVAAKAFGGYGNECTAGSVVVNNSNNYNLGRTTTHELGHYYGLRHTFQGCGSGDYIDDTPSQSEPNYGVPTIGSDCISTAHNTCGTQDFFFNYMDYTNDVAMYMFTSDQSDLLYDVALEGNYKSESTTCSNIPNSYNPTFPNGCFECPELVIIANIEDTDCYHDCDGSISIDDVIDGEAPFSYVWSNGETTPVIENLCSGQYSVTITDDYNCEVTESFFVDEPEELTASTTVTHETGNNFEDGTASAEGSGGTSPYYYNWSNGESSSFIENLAPGSYTVTVSDFNGCEFISSVIVEEFICPALTVQYTFSNLLCNGECTGEITISGVNNGVPPFTYIWNNGETSAILSDLCAGEYVATVTDALNCPVESDTIILTEPTELLISTSSTNETAADANDGTATVTPDGGTLPHSYLWSNGETTQTIVNLPPGTYTVIVTDAHGCQKEDWAEVEEYYCPDLSLVSFYEDASCFNGCDGWIEIQDLINGVEPLSFDWSNGEVSAIVNDLCAGTYEVTITDAENCSFSQVFEIAEPEEILLNLSSTDESAYQANDGTASVSQSGGVYPYSYLWSNGSNNTTITNLSPGEYSVTVNDANNCTSAQSVIIHEFVCPEMEIVSGQSAISCHEDCDGSIEIIDVTNASGELLYSWSNGSTASFVDDLCAGLYTISITDGNECLVETEFELSQPEELLANASVSSETSNDANDGIASSNPVGGTAPYTYQWSTGSTSPDITDLSPGAYTVTVNDANNCTSIQTVIIQEYECPEMQIMAELSPASCFGSCDGKIEINDLTNSTGILQYSWSNESTASFIDHLCADQYFVTVTDEMNCAVLRQFDLTQPDELLVSATSNPETANGANDGSATCNPSGGTAPYSYVWNNGETTQDIDNLTPGNYWVTVTDNNSCESVDSVNVAEYACSGLSIQSTIVHSPCFEYCQGSIEVTGVENAVEPLTYTWSNGETSSSLNSLCPGLYQLTITDANDCIVEQEYLIKEPGEMIISIDNIVHVKGEVKGSIDISVNGDYLFEWTGENGFTSKEEDLSGLEFGCYQLIVTDPESDCKIDTLICIEDLTGTSDWTDFGVRVYPNPVNEKLTFDFSSLSNKKASIRIMDAKGYLVKEIEKDLSTQKVSFDTRLIDAGIYHVQISREGKKENLKVVVIH